jgi:DNA polymerase (family 10)
VTNAEIAKVFHEIADLLERKKESPFKIRAYRRAAESFLQLPDSLDQVMQRGELRDIPGVGEAIAKKTAELLTTGRLEYYERLLAEDKEDDSPKENC